jgi:hypothetical protein
MVVRDNPVSGQREPGKGKRSQQASLNNDSRNEERKFGGRPPATVGGESVIALIINLDEHLRHLRHKRQGGICYQSEKLDKNVKLNGLTRR